METKFAAEGEKGKEKPVTEISCGSSLFTDSPIGLTADKEVLFGRSGYTLDKARDVRTGETKFADFPRFQFQGKAKAAAAEGDPFLKFLNRGDEAVKGAEMDKQKVVETRLSRFFVAGKAAEDDDPALKFFRGGYEAEKAAAQGEKANWLAVAEAAGKEGAEMDKVVETRLSRFFVAGKAAEDDDPALKFFRGGCEAEKAAAQGEKATWLAVAEAGIKAAGKEAAEMDKHKVVETRLSRFFVTGKAAEDDDPALKFFRGAEKKAEEKEAAEMDKEVVVTPFFKFLMAGKAAEEKTVYLNNDPFLKFGGDEAEKAAAQRKKAKLLAVAEAGMSAKNPFEYGLPLANDPRMGSHERTRQELIKSYRAIKQLEPHPFRFRQKAFVIPGTNRQFSCPCPDCNDPDAYGDAELPKSWAARVEEMKKNEVKTILEFDSQNAQAALDFYNHKHGVNYELVKTLGTSCHVGIGAWHHCNFMACRKHDSDPSPKLFFAELRALNTIDVKTCCILVGQIVRGCGFCPPEMGHPVNGFEAGCRHC